MSLIYRFFFMYFSPVYCNSLRFFFLTKPNKSSLFKPYLYCYRIQIRHQIYIVHFRWGLHFKDISDKSSKNIPCTLKMLWRLSNCSFSCFWMPDKNVPTVASNPSHLCRVLLQSFSFFLNLFVSPFLVPFLTHTYTRH